MSRTDKYEKDGFVFESKAEYIKVLVGTIIFLIIVLACYAFIFYILYTNSGEMP